MTSFASAQKRVSFSTEDGGLVHADLYGSGERAVVLAHGKMFNAASWSKQATALEQASFRVLAIDFRGYGESRAGSKPGDIYLDVLAAVRYLHSTGAKSVSVLGGSMGGGASARASVESAPGEIDRLILLAPAPIEHPERMKGRKLFICSRGDALMPDVQRQYDAAPDPKELIVLDGSAHAQHIFNSPTGDHAMSEILRFLNAP